VTAELAGLTDVEEADAGVAVDAHHGGRVDMGAAEGGDGDDVVHAWYGTPVICTARDCTAHDCTP
jgi:hypothetical protein